MPRNIYHDDLNQKLKMQRFDEFFDANLTKYITKIVEQHEFFSSNCRGKPKYNRIILNILKKYLMLLGNSGAFKKL